MLQLSYLSANDAEICLHFLEVDVHKILMTIF